MFLSVTLDWVDYLIIGLVCLVLVSICLVVSVLFFSKKSKLKKVEAESKEVINNLYTLVIELCGGKENIIDVNSVGSRVSILVDDSAKINKEGFKENDVKDVIFMSNKIVILIGSDAVDFAEGIKDAIKK